MFSAQNVLYGLIYSLSTRLWRVSTGEQDRLNFYSHGARGRSQIMNKKKISDGDMWCEENLNRNDAIESD
jgi:hypothetical protein